MISKFNDNNDYYVSCQNCSCGTILSKQEILDEIFENTFKIIGRSNLGDDSVSDIVLAENLKENWAKRIANNINKELPEDSTYFYTAVPWNYKLYKFEP